MSIDNRTGEVALYFENRWSIFERWWCADETLAIHYPYYDKDTKNFKDAIYNMNNLVGKLLGLKPHTTKNILDAGCGVGGTSIYLAQKYPEIQFTGITITPGQVELAKRFIRERNVNNVTVVLGDYTNTDFPSNSFDGAFAIESVSYTENIEDFVEEMHRVLKPGGILVVLDGFRTGVEITPLMQKIYEQFLLGRGYHNRKLPLLSVYRTLLEKRGFSHITIKDISKHLTRSLYRSLPLGFPFFVFMMLKWMITFGTYDFTKHFQEFSMGVSVLSPIIAQSNVTRYYVTVARKNEGNL